MSTIADNDLKRLEDLIINGQKATDARLTAIDARLTGIESRLTNVESRLTGIETDIMELRLGQRDIKGDMKTLDAKIEGISERIKPIETTLTKIPDLAEKVGELKNWRQIVIIAITAIISSTVTWLARSGNLRP